MLDTLVGMGRKATGKTGTVRVSGQIHDMVNTIAESEGLTTAQICDPILLDALFDRYQRAEDNLSARREEIRALWEKRQAELKADKKKAGGNGHGKH